MKKILMLVVMLSLIAAPAFASVDAAAKFFDGLEVKSDMVVYYEGWFDDEVGGNSAAYGYGGNLNDRSRGRYRLRIGFTKQVNDEISVDVRFATGAQGLTSNAQSFNDNFANDEFDVDVASITWRPAWVNGLTLTAGKMVNPFFTNGSEIIWDADVTPEGTAQSYEFELANISFTYTQAQFFLEDNGNRVTYVPLAGGVSPSNLANEDAYMLGFQLGGDYDGDVVDLGLYAGYYNFNHMRGTGLQGNGNTNVWVNPTTTAARQEFRIFDLLGYVRFDLGLPMQLTAEWVHNVDAQPVGDFCVFPNAGGANPIAARTKEDDGWMIRWDVNKARNPGDWAFSYTYANVEADAVVDGLNDGYLTAASMNGWSVAGAGARGVSRNTNVESHRFQLSYVLLKNTTVCGFYQISEPEDQALARVQDDVVTGAIPTGYANAINGWSVPDRQEVVLYMVTKW